jgi:molybdopterin/thiamine biosynthesis adenylyltransferase
MTDWLVIPAPTRALLAEALIRPDRLEHLVVGFAGRHQAEGVLRLLVRELTRAEHDDYLVQSGYHLEMNPAFWARIAKRARGSGESIVVFHSHPCDMAVPDFSPSDDWGEDQLLPKLMARAAGPHATVVWAPGGVRARLHSEQESSPLEVSEPWSIAQPDGGHPEPVYARQVLALGAEGQARLAAARVGVVGLGGTGSHVAQQLLHLGVGTVMAIDPDRVEMSNLSRIVGATEDDVRQRRLKVEITQRLAAGLGHRSRFIPIAGDIRDDDVARSLVNGVDVIVGCTDTQWSRLILNAVAFSYYIPVVDLGVELQAQGAMGGRITVAGPGDSCLWCLNVINEKRLRAEQLPSHLRAAEQQLGYVPDLDVPAPAVVSINGVIASLAVSEVLDRIVHLRDGRQLPPTMLLYRLTDGTVRRVAPHSGGCAFCTGAGLGVGDLGRLPTRPTVKVQWQDRSNSLPLRRLRRMLRRGWRRNADTHWDPASRT